MSDSFVTVRRTGCLGNLMNSLVGAVIGVALFAFAFPVIWVGEGRTNLAEVAATSVVADPAQADRASEGRLVAVTGPVTAAALGDSPYLRPGAYLRLQRLAEMYAWVEDEHTEHHDEPGGGTRTETTYSYSKRWTSSPESGRGFHDSSGHLNPAMEFDSATLSADGGRVGVYRVDLGTIDLPSAKEVLLRPGVIGTGGGSHLDGNYLLMGRSSLGSPRLGDVRISYTAVMAGQSLTVFGAQRSDQVVAYSTAKGDRLYRALEGDRAAAIKQLQIEDTITDWLIRGAALLMMWVGLSMALGPISAAVGVLPFIRQTSGCLIGLLTLAVALPIWAVTVLVAILAHNLLLMAVVALLGLGGAAVFVGMRRQTPAQGRL